MSSTATSAAPQPRWKVIEGDSFAAKASKLAEALEMDPRPLMDRPLEWHRPAVGCFWHTRCGEFSIAGYRDGTETGVELFRSGRSMGRHLRLSNAQESARVIRAAELATKPVKIKGSILHTHMSFHSGICACGTESRQGTKFCRECQRPLEWI